jgi:Ca2+-binding EF-hand superfamily protein
MFWGEAELEKPVWDDINHHNLIVEKLMETEDPPAVVLTASVWGVKGTRPNPDTGEENSWFRFPLSQLLICKAVSTGLVVFVTRNQLGRHQSEDERTHTLYACQTKSAKEGAHFASTMNEMKSAWTVTAKSIMLENFVLRQIASSHVRMIAQTHDVTPAQVLIRWALMRWNANKGVLKLPNSIPPLQCERLFDIKGWLLTDAELASVEHLDPSSGRTTPTLPPSQRLHALSGDMEADRRSSSSPKFEELQPDYDEDDESSVRAAEPKFDPLSPAEVFFAKQNMVAALPVTLPQLQKLLAQLRDQFPNGKIGKPQLCAVILDNFDLPKIDAQQYVTEVYDAFDVLDTKFIMYELYVVYLSAAMGSKPKDQLEAIFRIFDADNSGSLDIDEMAQLVRIMIKFDPENGDDIDQMDTAEIGSLLLSGFDENGDGVISLAEWTQACESNPALKSMLEQAAMGGDDADKGPHLNRPTTPAQGGMSAVIGGMVLKAIEKRGGAVLEGATQSHGLW